MATATNEHKLIFPDSEETERIQRVNTQLTKTERVKYLLVDREDGVEMELPRSLFQVLVQAAGELAKGNSVAIMHYEQELTTQQAADLLQVSRPYLIRLLEEGNIRYHMTGSHRRIRMGDLQEYKKVRDERRRANLREMVRVSESLGLYDTEGDPGSGDRG